MNFDFRHSVPAFFRKIPFRAVLLIAVLLCVVGDRYPFSPFPMYSNFEHDARVLYVSSQDDTLIPLEEVFGLKSSVIKKIYKAELRKICKPESWEDADAAQRQEAGEYVLNETLKNLRSGKLAPYDATGIRLHEKIIALIDGEFTESVRLIAEVPVDRPTERG